MGQRKATKKTDRRKATPQAPRSRSLRPPRSLVVAPAASRKDYAGLISRLLRSYADTPRSPMPQGVQPMLATLAAGPFNNPEWQFEIKWDGYRSLAALQKGKVLMRSRNGRSFNEQFAPVAAALREWGIAALVDGEVVVLDDEGQSDFGALQRWSRNGGGHLYFYVFDLLWLDGVDLRGRPLHERRALLRQLVPEAGIIRFSDSIDEFGADFFAMIKKNGLEGMIAKDRNAPYADGRRSTSWLKIKALERREAVICGYTRHADTDRLFSALVLGIPEGKGFRYIGQVGTGFSRTMQEELMRQLVPLQTRRSPFEDRPALNAPVDWVRPLLVCEVNYTEETREGLLRHPSYKGLRADKTVLDVNPEAQVTALLVAPGDTSRIVERQGQPLKLTNLQKVFWPGDGRTKGNLVNYYAAVSPYLMPYLKDRPQSLHRHPNGIDEKSFYQKNMAGRLEKWLHTFRRVSSASLLPKYYLVCHDEAHLLYMINMGCIELHPWHSTVQQPAHPSWCVVDLDPGDRIGFDRVVEAALVVKHLLDTAGIASYPKTSGATGLHIYIPLGQRYSYDQSRQLAELVARLTHAELPKTTSIERDPAMRQDRIYLDFLQNRPTQTICAPYCVRPRPGAPVSAPLHWSEVRKGLRPEQFTIDTMSARLRAEGDLFAGVLERGIDMHQALHRIENRT